ncbi:MAG: MurR/RpiR family transcriptional regulator [Burkholderiaceae bacterium]
MKPRSSPGMPPPPPVGLDRATLDARLQQRFAGLAPQLRSAARYVLDHPADVAMCSMRAIARRAGVPHVTMLRLARRLDLADYEAMRAVYRDWLGDEAPSLSDRGRALRAQAGHGQQLLADMIGADLANLQRLEHDGDTRTMLERAARRLLDARHCHVLGLRSLFAPAHYLNYACGLFLSNVSLITGLGGLRSDELRHIGPRDVLIAFSAEPYAQDTIDAVEQARDAGAAIIAITDSRASPIARDAAATLLFGHDSPSLFPSIVPAVALAQSLVAMTVAVGDERVLRALSDSEAGLQRLAVYLPHSPR